MWAMMQKLRITDGSVDAACGTRPVGVAGTQLPSRTSKDQAGRPIVPRRSALALPQVARGTKQPRRLVLPVLSRIRRPGILNHRAWGPPTALAAIGSNQFPNFSQN